jgi:hypothetical protein
MDIYILLKHVLIFCVHKFVLHILEKFVGEPFKVRKLNVISIGRGEFFWEGKCLFNKRQLNRICPLRAQVFSYHVIWG